MARKYSFSDASQELGIPWHLVGYLVRDRQIPTRRGRKNARELNEAGMQRLREALAEYRAKPDPEHVAMASA